MASTAREVGVAKRAAVHGSGTKLCFPPVLAPLLRERAVAGVLVGFAGLQMLFLELGLAFWRCPFNMIFGQPCPGCGLSRAMGALLAGDLAGAMRFHPFSPLFAAAALLLAVSLVLPRSARKGLADRVESLERRSGIAFIVLAGVVAYGVVRMFTV